ncbi:MAG: TPM domain-containing protein [Pseudanabaenaceae cyanobacterium SKYGB_i_bin29]|nr:TPM domain-containing protein [Pseudanabaenaceae cyanobacterium SKYG29]MDW8420796.1 TPM domain-containing protein [Pseudanabaenaceae cyanobacterium SKYGB_i_bin29]
MRRLLVFLLSVCLIGGWMLPLAALEIADIPDLPANDRTWIVDFADVISSATEGEISRKLDGIEKATGKAVRFITVPRIDFGQPAQEFLEEVFAKWFPDPEAGKNQALVLIAAQDHRTAWQAGEEIQSILTPDFLNSVTEETMLPPVQAARFNQALQDGAKRLLAVLAGEPDPGPPVVVAQVQKEAAPPVDTKTSTTWVIALLAAATIVPMVTYFLMQRN